MDTRNQKNWINFPTKCVATMMGLELLFSTCEGGSTIFDDCTSISQGVERDLTCTLLIWNICTGCGTELNARPGTALNVSLGCCNGLRLVNANEDCFKIWFSGSFNYTPQLGQQALEYCKKTYAPTPIPNIWGHVPRITPL